MHRLREEAACRGAAQVRVPTARGMASTRSRCTPRPFSTSNVEWTHPHDPDARVTKMKDGRTHLAHKAEHAVDLESGAVVGVTVQAADTGDTTSMVETLIVAVRACVQDRRDAGGPSSGHPNILKRLLVHVAGCNLGLLLRQVIGVGTPRSFQGRAAALFCALIGWWGDLWRHLRRLSTFSRPISAKTASPSRHHRFRPYV